MPLKNIRSVLQLESTAGILLLVSAIAAIAAVNSPLGDAYQAWVSSKHTVQIGGWEETKSIAKWVKDGLMAIFFLAVGLEIKKEVLVGELSDPRKLALPILAALGGMIAPALVFLALWSGLGGAPDMFAGWSVPVATDIAFAIAALSFVSKNIPLSLKIFLLTVAIADDLGAVVLIAVLYTSDVDYQALVSALAVFVVMLGMNKLAIYRVWPYLAGGIVMWAFMLQSGFHPTLAGVLTALAIPMTKGPESDDSPLDDLHHDLDPWVKYAIMPLFAFTAAGFSFDGIGAATFFAPLTMGIALGLLLGKPIGIGLAVFLATRLGIAKMPSGASITQIIGVAFLCGIGFTMSLFIGGLAFEAAPASYMVDVRVGVFGGSLLAAACGLLILSRTKPAPGAKAPDPDPAA
jgi:NhaA family Na+:H+ antiporter